ncbi:Flp family type IVb pilin [Sneathiella chinensis]|uniref:Flp family type IVb pilin n=1 Tax=Sneathiella chinensis TaxID=349750 RepID=A0ABQ5TYJ9_9PROT|nr:Flp family type IVb pilin [Sneathiella chinensis]GLQ05057.1 hypothetical protein GCM10007924_02780 [Sneathiella chinensis]
MIKMLNKFRKNESGATMVEYGLIVAVIAMVVVTAALYLGGNVQGTFGDAGECALNKNTADCGTFTPG